MRLGHYINLVSAKYIGSIMIGPGLPQGPFGEQFMSA